MLEQKGNNLPKKKIQEKEMAKTTYQTSDGYNLITHDKIFSDTQIYSEIGPQNQIAEATETEVYRDTGSYYEPAMGKLVQAWTKFNKAASQLDDFYQGKTEKFLLETIFDKIIKISRELDMNYLEAPCGVFCTSKEELIKLDILLEATYMELKKRNDNPWQRFKKWCRRMTRR